MQIRYWSVIVVICAVGAVAWIPTSAAAGIDDFHEWKLVEDPPNAGLDYSVDSGSQVTLSATGATIPFGTDIGFQSVNGNDVAGSTEGWAFDRSQDFSVAINFDLSFTDPMGAFTIGFGIGEDRDGMNSAGVILTSFDGVALAFAGAGRVDNANRAAGILLAPQLTGRFLVAYEATSGDVTVGVSTDGDNIAEATGTFSGIQTEWNDKDLLVSFFARGDNGIANWTSGMADAVYSDFEVTGGSPFAVPEPSTFVLAFLGLLSVAVVAVRGRLPWAVQE